jgi:hypothetical protein
MKDKILKVARYHTTDEETAKQLTNELCVLFGVRESLLTPNNDDWIKHAVIGATKCWEDGKLTAETYVRCIQEYTKNLPD